MHACVRAGLHADAGACIRYFLFSIYMHCTCIVNQLINQNLFILSFKHKVLFPFTPFLQNCVYVMMLTGLR